MTKTETIRVMESHVSVRKFRPDPLEEDMVRAVLAAACRAPTSSNLQAYSLIVVRDPAVKHELSVLTGNQRHVEEAPVFVAVCADLSRAAAACEMHGREFQGHTMEMTLVSVIDATLVGMCAAVAAESLGLGTVMIGGVRNRPEEICQLLGTPPRCFVVFGLCLGKPLDRPDQKPRLREEALIHWERYDTSNAAQSLKLYDEALRSHYEKTGRPTAASSWTSHISEEFSRVRRGDLRAHLRRFGFPSE